MAKASKATVQVKKKRWVQIVAPKLFNEMPLGESYLLEAKDAVGRVVRVSVMQLTGEPQKQYITAGFAITGVVGDRCTTTIKFYRILPSALRRLVRRNKDKFEDSFIVQCKDGVYALVKPFIVARFKANGSVLAALRKDAREAFAQYATQVGAEQMFLDTISGKMQQSVQTLIRKTFPVASCEVRWLEILGTEKPKRVVITATDKPKKEAEAKTEDAEAQEASEAQAEQSGAEAPAEDVEASDEDGSAEGEAAEDEDAAGSGDSEAAS